MSDKKLSTPSLVGESIRNIDDSNNPDFQETPYSNTNNTGSFSSHDILMQKLQSSAHEAVRESPYTSVDELNREGALLTDEVDLDQVVNVTSELVLDDHSDTQRRLILLKKKRQAAAALVSSSSLLSATQSLVTSTDPIDDQISIISSSNEDAINDNCSTSTNDKESIRNSYGEFIINECHKPHLARGDSYQKSIPDDEKRTSGVNERQSRSFQRERSTEYLRSISRSLSRDPKDITASSALNDDPRMYSTNNYSISQMELAKAPHIIEQPLIEEDEDDTNDTILLSTPYISQARQR